MAPAKKPTRTTNKRSSSLNEVSPEKDEVGSSKSKQQKKKELSDKLGSKWNEKELEQFYKAYRKYGKDWKKVAAVVDNKSVEMVKDLYNMNRAYLSLPEGIASVVGLIAMMTDYYSLLEKSDSERESNDVPGSQKPMKRKHGKNLLSVFNDSVQPQSIASNDGCLSLLKKRQFDGVRPWAVGKRTPRVRVKYSDMENYVLHDKGNPKSLFDANDDKVALALAPLVDVALSEAAQRGGSPYAPQKPYKRSKPKFSPVQSRQRMHPESETVPAKFNDASIVEECLEDESSSQDALQTLADLSLMMPTSTMEYESSVQLKEEKMTLDKDKKCVLPEGTSTNKNKPPRLKEKVGDAVPGVGSSTREKSFGNILKRKPNKNLNPVQDRELYLKEKLSACLSSYMARRWCMFEWFYSAIDYPWFSKREFMEYLNHVDLGKIPKLTRVEWSVIKSSLGNPRRFSKHFLHGERQKLKRYRESVRKHYNELWTGIRDVLPIDLAIPLCAGQQVIALHSETREIHDGSVLTVDNDKYSVQFDQPELGVEFVMDIDCMPLNPLDNMPETLRRQIGAGSVSHMSKKPHMKGNPSFGGSMKCVSSGLVEKTPTSSSTLAEHKKDIDCMALNPLDNLPERLRWQIGAGSVPCMNKKPHMKGNSSFGGRMKCVSSGSVLKPPTSSSRTLAEHKKDSNAMRHLRNHNTYLRNSLPPQMNPKASSDIHDGLPSMMDGSLMQELGSTVVEIIKASRLGAHAMVNAAFQALSSAKNGEDTLMRIWQALDYADYQQLATNSRLPVIRSQEQMSGSFDYCSRSIRCSLKPLLNNASGQKLHNDSDKVGNQIPLELITSCVTTWIMTQTCAEQQYPPAEVAQILDSVVTSLRPCSPRNLPLYREIQTCMTKIKARILALIPA